MAENGNGVNKKLWAMGLKNFWTAQVFFFVILIDALAELGFLGNLSYISP